MIASSSNGRTADSDSVNLGSSPGEAANMNTRKGVFCWLLYHWARTNSESHHTAGIVAVWQDYRAKCTILPGEAAKLEMVL